MGIKLGIRGIIEGIDQISSVLEIVRNKTGNVLISRLGNAMVVSDPISITMGMNFGLSTQNTGLKLVKCVCRENGIEWGDGFSFFVMFLNYLNKEVLKMSIGGVHPPNVYRFLENEFDLFSEYIRSISEEDTPLDRVLSMVFYDDPLIGVVSNAFKSIGKNGNIIVECGKGVGSEYMVRDGIEVPFGISKKIPVDEFSLDQPMVAVLNFGLSRFKDVSPVIEESSELGRPVVIFSWFSEGEAVATWNLNREINGNKWFYIDVSGINRFDWLGDIAAISGATVVDKSAGMKIENFNNDWLGSVQSLVSDKNRTTLTCYDESPRGLEDRISSLRNQANESYGYNRDKLLERASRLDSGYCVIRVGGTTNQEMINNRSLSERMVSFSNGLLKSGFVTVNDAKDFPVDGILQSIIRRFGSCNTPIPSSILLDMVRKAISLSKEIMSSKITYSSE